MCNCEVVPPRIFRADLAGSVVAVLCDPLRTSRSRRVILCELGLKSFEVKVNLFIRNMKKKES